MEIVFWGLPIVIGIILGSYLAVPMMLFLIIIAVISFIWINNVETNGTSGMLGIGFLWLAYLEMCVIMWATFLVEDLISINWHNVPNITHYFIR